METDSERRYIVESSPKTKKRKIEIWRIFLFMLGVVLEPGYLCASI